MVDHLKDARLFVKQAESVSIEHATPQALVATAHGIIALVEQMGKAIAALTAIAARLPPPAETWSASAARLRKEEAE